MKAQIDKIICIGKNYLDHAEEMKKAAGDAVPEKPVLFLKPPSAALFVNRIGDSVEARLPRNRGDAHHECEVVIRLKSGGENLTLAEAEASIDAVTLGLDMTLRDLQAKLKKSGHPWEVGKVFTASAIVGPWISYQEFPDYLTSPFSFVMGGTTRQQGRGSEMRLSPAECIAYASEYFPLRAGDLLFTGTPAGVGPVHSGDEGELHWRGQKLFSVRWNA